MYVYVYVYVYVYAYAYVYVYVYVCMYVCMYRGDRLGPEPNPRALDVLLAHARDNLGDVNRGPGGHWVANRRSDNSRGQLSTN